MESSHMFLNALAYVAFIAVSGLSLLICMIFFIVRISQDHKQKWNWLIAAIISVFLLIFSIFLFTRKVVNTVKNIGEKVEETIQESVDELQKMDSSYQYSKLVSNPTLLRLKEFQHINNSVNAPDEFYVYFGYMNYFRMPLTYPYSLHCNDVLETAELYNEANVSEFNINDNGEVYTGKNSINAIAFDNAALIAQIKDSTSKKESYFIYSFVEDKQSSSIKTLKEAIKTARKDFNYRGYDTLITVYEYHQLFN